MDDSFKSALFAKAIASLDNAQLGEIMKEAFVAKGTGRSSENLSAAEIVRHMFLDGNLHKVPSAGELEVGKPLGATGADAEKQIKEYSDFAPQTQGGRTAQYEKLESMFGDLMSSMKAIADGMKTLTEITTETVKAKEAAVQVEDDEEHKEKEDTKEDEKDTTKSLVEQVTKSILVKAEDEEDEKEEDEEEDMGKSLSEASKIRFAKALIAGAVGALKSKDAGRGVQREVEKTARKAHALATAAAESKEKDIAKAAKSTLTDVEEFMFLHGISAKAKGKKDSMNQKKWADSEGFEKSMKDMQDQLHGLMNVVENVTRGRGMPTGIEILGTDSPLAKGGQNYFNDKIKHINEKVDAGALSELDQGAAEEMVSLMQAASQGRISETVVKNTVAMATPQVRSLFPEWLPGAKG